MIVAVFRTRMRPQIDDEYAEMARRMSELAKEVPGYVSHKGYVSDDGERVTIVEFASEEALETWRVNPHHMAAKRRGFESFFLEFRFQICRVLRSKSWSSTTKDVPPS